MIPKERTLIFLLEIKGLCKSYRNYKVLDGLDMSIKKGDVYGFLGKNGCGKTTTMNIICSIIPKDEGEILLGEDGSGGIRIGYLPEAPALYGYMNGYEYLGYIAYAMKLKDDVDGRIARALDITGMTEGGKRRIKGYSRGMNQRLGIAAAILSEPELLILDEPTSALDPEGRAEVMHIIKDLSSTGCTIILCTHILADVERVANRVGILKNGRLAAQGSIGEIMDSYRTDSLEIVFPEGDDAGARRAMELFEVSGFAEKTEYFQRTSMAVINVRDAYEGMSSALRLISDNDIKIKSVRLSQPTLEQVYLDIVGR